jgi:hypothetical protein
MSKLLEKLERISEGRGQPIGFGAAVNRTKIAPMLIIASVPAANAQLTGVVGKEGIDAILITVENLAKDKKVLAKIDNAKIGVPWGISMDAVTGEEIEQLIEIGCDFVIFGPAKTPAAVLNEDKIGKVLKIDPTLTDSMIRAISRLSVDAVFLSPVSEEEPHFTIQQLMAYERLAGGTGKHLLAAFPPGKPSADIESLWGLGVRGVAVDLTVDQPEQRLAQIKEAILKLPATRKKSKEKIRATLPVEKASSEAAESEEDDEE